jgi:hypothetical protein
MSCNIQKRRQMAATAQAEFARTRDQATSACQQEKSATNLQTPLQKMLAEREKQDQMWAPSEPTTKGVNAPERHG